MRWCGLFVVLVTSCASGSSSEAPVEPNAPGVPPVSYADLVGLSESYLESGRAEQALEVARDAIAKDDQRPTGYLALARALASSGKTEAAIASYESALERGADGRRATMELATLYDVVRRYDLAIATYQVHTKNHPGDHEGHQQLGLSYLITGQAAAGLKSLERARELAPENPQVEIDYSMALLQAGYATESLKQLRRITENESDRADAWRLLARAEATQRRWKPAMAAADRALALSPDDVDSLSVRCRLWVVQGASEQALQDCEALRAAQPEDRATALRTAGILAALGELEAADRLLTEPAQALPDHPAVRFRLDQIAARRGDPAAFSRIVELAEQRRSDPELWWEVLNVSRWLKKPKFTSRARQELKTLNVEVGSRSAKP